MNGIQALCSFLGRLFLSSIFILSSFSDMMDWGITKEYLIGTFTTTITAGPEGSMLVTTMEMLLPWASMLLALAIILKLVGGLLVLIGWKTRFGALLLMLFLVPTTLLMHAFWHMPEGAERMMQMIMFMKNASIFGGLWMILAFGKGCSKKACPPEKMA